MSVLARVTGLTLSKEQLAEATARVAAAGLSDKVTLLFCDYRYGWVGWLDLWCCCRIWHTVAAESGSMSR